MLILHVTRDYAPAHCGGTSTAVLGLTRALNQKGIVGRIVSFEQWRPRAKASGAPLSIERFEDFNVARLSTPDQLEEARNWAVEEPFDLIVVHHEMLWEFAFDIATNRSKPCVLVVHVLQAAMNRVRNIEERTMSLVAQEQALGEAHAVVATSEAVYLEIAEARPELKGKLYRLGLGIHRVAEQAKRAFEPTVIFSGRFDSIKRLSLLLAAMEKVVQVIPDARLIVMGGNPGNPKVERRWHRRLNSEVSAELRSRMTVTGWLHEGEIWQYLAQASIVALPSLYETFGLSVLEAMAQGLATVANPVGGLKELVQHERSGLWVDSNEPEPWANALIGLLKQPDLAMEMGETARRAVLENWLWSDRVDDWLVLFVKLCGVDPSKD